MVKYNLSFLDEKKHLSHGNKFKYVSVYGVAIKNDA